MEKSITIFTSEGFMQYLNYRESWQRGTVDFPFEFHHIGPSHPQYEMALHWHVEFELVRILEGSFQISIDGQEFTATKGFTMLIPAGTLHTGTPTDCIYECIIFDLNVLMNQNDSCCRLIRKMMNREVDFKLIYTASDQQIQQTVWSIFDAIASKVDGYQMIALGGLYQLIGAIFSNRYYEDIPIQPKRQHRRVVQLKTALEFIESGYNKPLSLEEMANSIGMSAKYFCRFFQEMTLRTPVDYLNYYRIERACYQLLTSSHSITEVAYSSGFNDLSYFIKTFKRYKGITPKQYLKA